MKFFSRRLALPSFRAALDVSGLVAAVLIRDNQSVHRGSVLFRINQDRFISALEQADAAARRGAVRMAD